MISPGGVHNVRALCTPPVKVTFLNTAIIKDSLSIMTQSGDFSSEIAVLS